MCLVLTHLILKQILWRTLRHELQETTTSLHKSWAFMKEKAPALDPTSWGCGEEHLELVLRRGYYPASAASEDTWGWFGKWQKRLEGEFFNHSWSSQCWGHSVQNRKTEIRNSFFLLLFFQLPMCHSSSSWQNLGARWQRSLGNVVCRVGTRITGKSQKWKWRL